MLVDFTDPGDRGRGVTDSNQSKITDFRMQMTSHSLANRRRADAVGRSLIVKSLV